MLHLPRFATPLNDPDREFHQHPISQRLDVVTYGIRIYSRRTVSHNYSTLVPGEPDVVCR